MWTRTKESKVPLEIKDQKIAFIDSFLLNYTLKVCDQFTQEKRKKIHSA